MRESGNDEQVHEYDGIIEHDNRLPLWWLYTLYGAVAFALVYWFQYEVLHASPSPAQEYATEVAQGRAAEAERVKKLGVLDDTSLITLSRDVKTVDQGKTAFVATCGACHRADGGGNIGPNLTDAAWIHGPKPTDILKTIRDGVTAKGMPAWGPQLGEERVAAVTAFVLTLRDTHVAGGKAPQGDIVTR